MWKLTYPFSSRGDKKPLEKRSDDLEFDDVYFVEDGDYYVMTVFADGAVTTKGSKYPRLEFRELNADGSLASWDFKNEEHVLIFEGSILEVPEPKPQVVFGQVHDDKDDLFFIRLTKDKLEVKKYSIHYGDLITNYERI